jgi:hypothetical protein
MDSNYPECRLYIDECGTFGFKKRPMSLQHRYLGLTGAAVTKGEMLRVKPIISKIKTDYFGTDSIILRRENLREKKGPYSVLADPATQGNFNQELLTALSQLDCVVFSVVVDKESYKAKYGPGYLRHPYHDCMYELTHSYSLFLHQNNTSGDIMIESRDRVENGRLQDAFSEVYTEGYHEIEAEFFQSVITSKKLKFRKKEHNVDGLQIADCLAYPCKYGILEDKGIVMVSPDCFSHQVLEQISDKYFVEGVSGDVCGYGRILLT